MSQSIVILGAIILMLVAGVLGGAINYLQGDKSGGEPAPNGDHPPPDGGGSPPKGDDSSANAGKASLKAGQSLPKSIAYYYLLSIAAAFCVPFILNLTKADFLHDVLTATPPANLESWFSLFAVCIIAAVYARSFLESVSKSLIARVESAEKNSQAAKQDAQKASGNAAKAEDIAKKTFENAINVTGDTAAKEHVARVRAATAHLTTTGDPVQQKILQALQNPKYPLGRRTMNGIISETKLGRAAVSAILDKLVADGSVKKETGEISDMDYYVLQQPPK